MREPASNGTSPAASQKFADLALVWLMLATSEERALTFGYPVLSLLIPQLASRSPEKGVNLCSKPHFDRPADQSEVPRCKE